MRLELVWSDRKATAVAQPQLRFLDFQVDSRSLSEAHKLDLVACLGCFVPEQDELAARWLLGEAPPDVENRVALFVCPECGDVLCGATELLSEGGW